MKKNILFIATGGAHWMGGVYYIKNQIAQLLAFPPARKKLKIFLYTNEKCKSEYKDLEHYDNINYLLQKEICKKSIVNTAAFLFDDLDADVMYIVYKYRIAYIFPYFPKGKINQKLLSKKSISWIADFQHIYFPQFFSKEEIRQRDSTFLETAKEHNKLVLSSHDAYKDYLSRYEKYNQNVYVIPFISALSEEDVMRNCINEVKDSYNITGKYYIICNQFWTHKNHLFVFKALKRIIRQNPEIKIVCTGNLNDYRNPNYIKTVKDYIKNNQLKEHIKILGLVNKKDQIQLIKGAVALIQPSMFEGWATCVEDAKTLGQKIFLSDIPVHREQMDEHCQLFAIDNTEQLEHLMITEWNNTQVYITKYLLHNAAEYGERFYNMIME